MERRSGQDRSATTSTGRTPTADAPFDDVVRQLVDDRSWRRRVRLAHLRHWAGVVARCGWHGLADVGCWFTAVPPQRCAGSGACRFAGAPARP